MEGFQDSLPSSQQRSLGLEGSGPAARIARKTSQSLFSWKRHPHILEHCIRCLEHRTAHPGPWNGAVTVTEPCPSVPWHVECTCLTIMLQQGQKNAFEAGTNYGLYSLFKEQLMRKQQPAGIIGLRAILQLRKLKAAATGDKLSS